MDFLKKFATEATGDNTATTTAESKGSSDHPQASQAELFASAQVVADAARATFQKDQSNKVDNAKVAGAAADLLDGAQKYGKLDSSTGIGSYVEKAENYLHQYESSNSTTPEKKATTPSEGGEPAKAPPAPATEETEHPTTEEGGVGGYVKMAEGFLNKGSENKSSESGDSGSGGYGDMMKMAGNFLKKN